MLNWQMQRLCLYLLFANPFVATIAATATTTTATIFTTYLQSHSILGCQAKHMESYLISYHFSNIEPENCDDL